MAEESVRTITDWLCDSVNFSIPENAAKDILVQRSIDPTSEIADVETKDKELAKADLFVWMCTSPNRVGDSSDSDNSWSHKVGGFTLSEDDKKRLMSLANAIYTKYDESKVGVATVRLNSFGIRKVSSVL